MPTIYALAAHPVGRAALQLAQEEHKTKGFRAVFGVIIMFGALCGGVWMLLQSSFGPKQAYLISSIAFWGCWLVLSLIWLTGVPGFKLGPLDIPRSTPRFYGPQGEEAHWVIADPTLDPKVAQKFAAFEAKSPTFFTIDDSVTDTTVLNDKAAAETAAGELVPEKYAIDLSVGAADISIPTVVTVVETRLAKQGGGFKYAEVTFGPAQPNGTNSAGVNDLITKIKPKTVKLYLESGNLATPTYYAIGLFLLLFLAHLGALVRYELNRVPQPQGAPERVPAAV